MAHCNTVFHQMLKLFPRHEFEVLAKEHHTGQKFRAFNRWTQFGAMMLGQLTGRLSLRDIVSNMRVQANKLYHLGFVSPSRATLARTNERQPATFYEALFQKLLARTLNWAPGHRFRFRNRLYLLDSTTIDLCLSLFPWATFRSTKGAIKLHVGLDGGGYLPTFVDMTEASTHEIIWARGLTFPRGSLVVFDKGFNDYEWYDSLDGRGIFFVSRLKKNALVTPLKKRPGRKPSGVLEDRTILLGDTVKRKYRRVIYKSPEDGHVYTFITNAFHLQANIVAEVYKERWQIEIFFKWIKQNLRIKTFLGTSRNAVMTQIWIALCVYLLLSFIKFRAKIGYSIHRMLRLLQLNLFERRNMFTLFEPPPPKPTSQPLTTLPLFKYL